MARPKKPQLPQIRFPWLPAIALFLLAVLTYIPSMSNGFIWDDPQYVVDNPTLKSADGLWQMWTDPTSTPQYYPMVHSTFWLESRLWGTDYAPGFHVDNILLHALAAMLLWRALLSLEIPAAWLAAAIFAVHPVMVESVAWITERKNVLSIVFYLLAFHAYRRSGWMADPKPVSEVHRRSGSSGKASDSSVYLRDRLEINRGWYIAALVLFLLALLSKTVTCSLPAAILLIRWWKRGRVTWRDIKPLTPMLILGLALSAITAHLEHTIVGARGADFDWSIFQRCLIAGHAICFYALKVVWPHPLMFMYPRWDLHDLAGWIYPPVVVIVVTALFAARRWIGRGPLVAVLFFIGTLFPALGFVNVYPMRYSFVADHFQYLASIGIITLIAVGLYRISRFTVIVVLPLAWISWHQQSMYADAKTLWIRTIAQNESCWMAHTNLAEVLRHEKDLDGAMAQGQRGLQLAPNEADTNYDCGLSLAEHGRWEEAIAQYRRAIQCDPQCAPAWSDLSQILWDHRTSPQDQAEAYRDAQRALSIQPNLGSAHYVVARVAELRGDLRTAIAEYGKALDVNDGDYPSHFNLGNCLLQAGQLDAAAEHYLKVLAHNPRDLPALTNLANANLLAGRTQQASDLYRKALAIDPNWMPAREGLKKMGQPSQRSRD